MAIMDSVVNIRVDFEGGDPDLCRLKNALMDTITMSAKVVESLIEVQQSLLQSNTLLIKLIEVLSESSN